jgi:hypothetical protein
MVVTDTYEQADRLESYRRVAAIAAEMKIKTARHRAPALVRKPKPDKG